MKRAARNRGRRGPLAGRREMTEATSAECVEERRERCSFCLKDRRARRRRDRRRRGKARRDDEEEEEEEEEDESEESVSRKKGRTARGTKVALPVERCTRSLE